MRTLKEFARTLRDALQTRLGASVGAERPIMTWLISHAAAVYRRYFAASDGWTAYQRNKGKPSSSALVEFGEKVYYRPLGTKQQLGDAPRFELGCFIGLAETSNEVIMVTEGGNVVKSRALRRLPKSQRWDLAWLQRLEGTEIQPNPGEQDTGVRTRVDPGMPADLVPVPPPPRPVMPRTRSVKLTEADFWEAGFSENCRGCQLILEGSKQSKVHTAACRKRMEEFLATTADGARRLQAAEERRAAAAAAAAADAGPGGAVAGTGE